MAIENIIMEEISKLHLENEGVDLTKLMDLVNKYPNRIKYYKTPLPSDKFVLSFPEPKDPNMIYDDKVVVYEYMHEPMQGIGSDEPHWVIRIQATTPTGKPHGVRSSKRTTDTNKVYQHMMRSINLMNKLDKNLYNL